MKRLSLLLLDANVVIHLFELGLWDKVIEHCDVHLARTVADDECRFYEDDDGQRTDIDLSLDVSARRVTIVEMQQADMNVFLSQFDPVYLEKLDPGEAESLAYLLKTSEETLFCSADKIVFRVLGNLTRSHQGISLEEVLNRIGHSRRLKTQYSKKYREDWSNKGFGEGLCGTGTTGGRKS